MTENTADSNSKKNLIEVRNLVKYFPVKGGVLRRVIDWVKAVDDVSFTIREGETLGLVGESGCGKTTVGHTMLNLIEPTRGEVIYEDTNLFDLRGSNLKTMRRHMQIVFQDPYGSLDPRLPIGDSISEGLSIHKIGDAQERFERVLAAMKKVGLEDYHAMRYPHEFSGGQRQRVLIARALVSEPEILLLDEPTSNVDIAVEDRLSSMLESFAKSMTVILITHDLGFVSHLVTNLLCVNETVRFHPTYEVTSEMIHSLYEGKIRMVDHGEAEKGHM